MLAQGQRTAVLDSLCEAADAEGRSATDAGLRQQAVYLLGSLSPSRRPLGVRRAREARLQRRLDTPGPEWLHTRALAIALANHGDKGPLLDFLDRGLATDGTRELNLRYYAAWLGDTAALVSWSQLWRPDDASEWSEYLVLRGLLDSLRDASPILELTARSLRLILDRSPDLGHTAAGRATARRAAELLENHQLTSVARLDLTTIASGAGKDANA